MYSICITGTDKDKKVHEVFSTSFKRSELSPTITKMFDDLTGAPFYCYPDMMHIKNDDTGADSFFMFYTDDNKYNEIVAFAWANGWISRDDVTSCKSLKRRSTPAKQDSSSYWNIL